MKILHTSDWHLGRYFHNVSLLADQDYFLRQLTQTLHDQQVDVLLIAGDIFDRSVPSVQAIELLNAFLDTVCVELKIHTILIPGNHDSAERLGFAAQHMENSQLHILADLRNVTSPVNIKTGAVDVDFWGLPYVNVHVVNDVFDQAFSDLDSAHTFMLQKIHQAMGKSRRNILLSHCFVVGGEQSDSERPLSVGGMDQVSTAAFEPFDYVALGHLHAPQSRSQETIRYSGSPLKYSFSESGHKKSLTLLELDSEGKPQLSFLPVLALRDVRIIEGEIDEIIRQARSDEHIEDYISVILTNQQAILDPLSRLREVYPNILHLERQQTHAAKILLEEKSVLQRDALELFKDFFQQMSGNGLSVEQCEILDQVFEVARKEDQ